MIEEKKYNKDKSIRRKTIHKYNSKGNIIETLAKDVDDILLGKSIYEYNKNNRIIEYKRYYYKSRFGELEQIPKDKNIYDYVEY